MRHYFISLFLILLTSSLSVGKTSRVSVPLQEVLDKKLVLLKIKSLGGHSGECVQFIVKNTSADTLNFYLEAGRRLIPDSVIYQSIFIAKERKIQMKPGANLSFSAFGFCSNAPKSSPKKGRTFLPGSVPDSNWAKLGIFLSAHELKNGQIQDAVWVLSNNHQIASVLDDGSANVTALRKLLAEIKKMDLPNYSISFIKSDSLLFSGLGKEITSTLDYSLKNACAISILVKNERGVVVKSLSSNMPQKQGKFQYPVKIDIRNWKKGKYKLVIQDEMAMEKAKLDFEI